MGQFWRSREDVCSINPHLLIAKNNDPAKIGVNIVFIYFSGDFFYVLDGGITNVYKIMNQI